MMMVGHKHSRQTNYKINVPRVGGRHFSYSKAGKKAAASYAKKKGKKVTKRKSKKKLAG